MVIFSYLFMFVKQAGATFICVSVDDNIPPNASSFIFGLFLACAISYWFNIGDIYVYFSGMCAIDIFSNYPIILWQAIEFSFGWITSRKVISNQTAQFMQLVEQD